jgi:hypothetical protein
MIDPSLMGSLADLPDAPQPTSVVPIGLPTVKQPGGYQPAAPRPAQFGADPMLVSLKSGAGAAAPAAAPVSGDAQRKALETRALGLIGKGMDTADEVEPAYEKAQAEERANLAEYQKGEQERLAQLDPRKLITAQAPKYSDYAKEASPFFMVLTAIGGKAAGVSGMGMIGALTGMVEGTQEGNMERYNAAYHEYQDHYKAQRDEYENLKAYIDTMQKYAGNNLIAKNQIAQQGLDMIGVKQNFAVMGVNTVKALDDTQSKLAATQLKIEKLHEKTMNDNEAARDRSTKEFEKIQTTATRSETAIQYLNRMKELMPQVVSKYKEKFGVVPKTFGELYIKLKDDPSTSEFQRLTKDLKSALMGIELPTGVRGNMYVEKVIGDTSPDLSTQNVEELSTAISGMQTWAGNVLQTQKQQMAVRNAYVIQAGGPNMMTDAGTQPYKSPFSFKKPEDVKKAVDDGVISYDAGAQIIRDKGWDR